MEDLELRVDNFLKTKPDLEAELLVKHLVSTARENRENFLKVVNICQESQKIMKQNKIIIETQDNQIKVLMRMCNDYVVTIKNLIGNQPKINPVTL